MCTNYPTVEASGVLDIFNEISCYVLKDGQRVFRLSYLTKALRGKEHGKHGKFGNYLAASNVQKYLPERLKPLNDSKHDRLSILQRKRRIAIKD